MTPRTENTTAIVDIIYPMVANSIPKNMTKYKALLSKFMNARYEQLYAVAPFDRIYYTQTDEDELFAVLNIDKSKVLEALSKTYYWPMADYKPSCAKDPLTIVALMIVRYFLLKKMDKELNMAMIYLSFSGKLYPSCHFGSFPKVVPREYEHIMLYVVNNGLSEKYDIKATGSVIGAVQSINNTWINTYKAEWKENLDETYTYLLQQLHTRIKSFMKNIAEEYYKAYSNKNSYITYDSDLIDNDGENTKERLADNDALKLERYVNKTIGYITTYGIDYKVCQMASDSNVKTDEIKTIIEGIISDMDNIPLMTELLRLQIGTYMKQSSTKDIRDIDYVTYSIKAKPNTKDKDVIRQKEIIENWLDKSDSDYRKRKTREATRLSYNRSLLKYFVLLAYNANK